jgi:hypothetical protein
MAGTNLEIIKALNLERVSLCLKLSDIFKGKIEGTEGMEKRPAPFARDKD